MGNGIQTIRKYRGWILQELLSILICCSTVKQFVYEFQTPVSAFNSLKPCTISVNSPIK